VGDGPAAGVVGDGPAAGVGVGEAARGVISILPDSPPPPPSTPTPKRIPTSAATTAVDPNSHFQLVANPIYATSNIQRMICSPN
jgi:hypothetical protein